MSADACHSHSTCDTPSVLPVGRGLPLTPSLPGLPQVSSLELEIRQLKDRLADEEEARESAETRQDGLRKNAAEKASALELERQKAAHELDVKDTQIVDLQSRCVH